MSSDNEGCTILLIVVCHMTCFRGYKSSPLCSCGYKNIKLISLIFVKVFIIKIKRNSIDTLSKLLTCVLLRFGRNYNWCFFIQDLHLHFHSFLGFRHGSGSSIKAIMPLSATLPLAIGLKCFWFRISNSIIVTSKVSHTWIIFPWS